MRVDTQQRNARRADHDGGSMNPCDFGRGDESKAGKLRPLQRLSKEAHDFIRGMNCIAERVDQSLVL